MEGFLLNDTDWINDFKEKRTQYGVSQNQLAVMAGVSREYVSRLESGKVALTDEIKGKFTDALDKLNPDNPLEMVLDYVRIRFPTQDVKHVVEDILKLRLDVMIHEDFGFYSYAKHYVLGDVFVLTSPDKEKGTLLELKGKGCRQMESYLLAQHRSWYDFLMDALIEGGVMKRLDLAINDMAGILDIPELTEKCNHEECISVFRSFKSYRSGELVRSQEQDKYGMGNTLYTGLIKRETTKAVHAVINFLVVFILSASFIAYAPNYISKINDFSADISSSALSLGTKIVLPDSSSKGKDSVDLIRDSLFSIQVKQPWLLLQYGESDIETLGSDRVESLLSASPDTDDREDVVIEEIEDKDNDNLSVTKTMTRLGMVVFLFIFNIGISVFVFLLTGMMIFSQVLFIIYAMFLPISFILSMIPTFEGM